MQKYLIVGLGNIGEQYEETRHNIGFKIVDALAEKYKKKFDANKLAYITSFKIKGKKIILIKPTTFMNLSGKAVKYWLDKNNISIENLLIITDDIHIDFGFFRLKSKGSDGGHNGLKDIQDKLQTIQYNRLKFGVGKGSSIKDKVNYVLGNWTDLEQKELPNLSKKASDCIENFILSGLTNSMNKFNGNQLEKE